MFFTLFHHYCFTTKKTLGNARVREKLLRLIKLSALREIKLIRILIAYCCYFNGLMLSVFPLKFLVGGVPRYLMSPAPVTLAVSAVVA